MGWFNSKPPQPSPSPRHESADPIPTLPVDLSKRYDVYCSEINHDRIYENVRFVAIRTFDRPHEFMSGLSGGFLEIEQENGTRVLIPSFGIRMLCEHGTQPVYKIY